MPPDAETDHRGIVLLSTLLLVAVMAALATGALQVATLEVRMAENATLRLLATELAESVIHDVLRASDAFPTDSTSGRLPCPGDLLAEVCDVRNGDTDWRAGYSIYRLAQTVGGGFFPRESESIATGVGHFDTAIFELAVRIDAPARRRGSFEAVQGVAIRVPGAEK